MTYATRFAPSPTGPLHIGHAYSALIAAERAAAAGGIFHLRFEDTDMSRVRPEWVTLIEKDLSWLGLNWPKPPLKQSDHFGRYDEALMRLIDMDLVYPCSCSRADIVAAGAAPQEGATYGPIYPGTCRGRSMDTRRPGDALRLDMERASDRLGTLEFVETGPIRPGTKTVTKADLLKTAGDIVLARKDAGVVSYFMASAIDDDFQSITEVVRGEDLFAFTAVQVLLLSLLGLRVPTYHHHKLIRDDQGKRLAKRDDARAISSYRSNGATPADIRKLVGL
ncbi:MAG: tRNA glutamyl-Q(34) synthetase GluQRS [Pseudomonadota bacterium]